MNVLFITLDQFRGDSYGAAGHPLVATPTLVMVMPLYRGTLRMAHATPADALRVGVAPAWVVNVAFAVWGAGLAALAWVALRLRMVLKKLPQTCDDHCRRFFPSQH